MTIADTDVLIDFLSDRGEAVKVTDLLARGVLCTTVITRFELLSGTRNAKASRAVMELLDAVLTLDLDTRAADAASEIRRNLEKAGNSIGMADSLIAGIVQSNNGTLLTRNRRHFERIQGLRLS